MDLVEYSNRNGIFVRSTELAKYLGVRHQDLIRKIERKSKGYIPHDTIKCKYSPNGVRVSYKLKINHIELLELYDLAEQMKAEQKRISEEIRIRIRNLFGGR